MGENRDECEIVRCANHPRSFRSNTDVVKWTSTGTPDLLLTFTNPQVLTDCAFHPCVRYITHQTLISIYVTHLIISQPPTMDSRQISIICAPRRPFHTARLPIRTCIYRHGQRHSRHQRGTGTRTDCAQIIDRS
jgi:hypothetical protein